MARNDEYAILRNVTSTIMNRTRAGTLRGMTGYISEFARLVNAKASDPKDVKQANKRLAETAQKAALARYDERRAASDTPGQYRMGQGRVSGGRLRKAIASPSFVTSDKDGFGVGNVSKLSKEAVHWARINYSAGPQATDYPAIQLRFDDRVVAQLQSNRSPQPLWNIPQGGYFIDGQMHILPKGGMSARPIKAAHEPYHFIERGFDAAAKQFGPEYETMMFGWLNKSGQQAKNFAKGVRLKGVTLK